MCVIPDKIVSMTCHNLQCMAHINKQVQAKMPQLKHGAIVDASLKIKAEHQVNLNGVHDTFKNFVYHYASGNNYLEPCQDLMRMMNIRFRANAPRRPPRVFILGAPGSGKSTTAEAISRRYGLVNVCP